LREHSVLQGELKAAQHIIQMKEMKQAILTLAILSIVPLLVSGAYFANAIVPPPAPDFTLRYMDNSYDVPSTYEIDPYTGKNTTTADSYHVENKSITLTIKNPAVLGPEILFHNISTKGHYENQSNWRYIYLINGDGGMVYLKASDYEYTMLVFGSTNNNGSDSYSLRISGIKADAKIDFAVKPTTDTLAQSKIHTTTSLLQTTLNT
jgi:hypothetical protein